MDICAGVWRKLFQCKEGVLAIRKHEETLYQEQVCMFDVVCIFQFFDIKCIFRFFSLSKISNRLFYLFQILKIGKNDLLAMEHTLLHLATVPGVTKGVFYFMAVPLEDDTWCVR